MWILFLGAWGIITLPTKHNGMECLKCVSVTFSCSTATASDTTGTLGGLNNAEVISISTCVSGFLGTLIVVAVTICGWYVNKKCKKDRQGKSAIY